MGTPPDPAAWLAAALDRFDAVAAGPRPSTIGGCTLCYTTEELEELTGPRDEVSDEVVAQVGREVPDHWDEFAVLYRWLAPRVLRTTIRRPELATFEGTVGARFVDAGWTDWPESERMALDEVLRAWWTVTLTASDPAPPTDDTLDFLVTVSGSTEPWLSIWAETPGEPATGHLAALVTWSVPELVDGTLSLGEWREHRLDLYAALRDWLIEHAPTRLVAAGIYPEAVAYLDLLADEGLSGHGSG